MVHKRESRTVSGEREWRLGHGERRPAIRDWPFAIRLSPIGAFLTAPGGLYDAPEDARLTVRRPPVKRRGLSPTLKSS
jgi:hypothetical protein